MKYRLITEEQVQGLLNYLDTQPHGRVRRAVDELLQLPEGQPVPKKTEADKPEPTIEE